MIDESPNKNQNREDRGSNSGQDRKVVPEIVLKQGIEARINPLGKNGGRGDHDSPPDRRRVRRKESEGEGQKKGGCRESQTQEQEAPKLLDVGVILGGLAG